jgi:hypothetical protein
MHGSINVKSPNNPSRWQMRFNSAFRGLKGKISSFSVTKYKTLVMCAGNTSKSGNVGRKFVLT